MWWFFGSLALAGTWTRTPLYTGVDISGSTGDVAAAVGVTGVGASARLYVALAREVPNGSDRDSQLYLGYLDCPGWTSCPAPTWSPVGAPQAGDGPLPALAIEDPDGDDPRVHLLHAERYTGCKTPVRKLVEDVFDPATSLLTQWPVRTPGSCADGQLSSLAVAADQVWACWTEDPVGNALDNQVWCGTRPLAPTPAQPTGWTTALLADGLSTQDHSSFTVLDGVRYAILRDRDPTPDAIDLYAGSVTTALPDGVATFDDDFPSIAQAPDGSLHAVWVESGRRLTYAKCEVGMDCTDPTNWIVQPRAVRLYKTGTILHPELDIAQNGRMFVFWTEDQDPGSTDQRRIHVKEKCRTDALFSVGTDDGDLIDDIGTTSDDQTLLLGRPHAWIDEADQTIHVAYLQNDDPDKHPNHGDAFWAWEPVDPCP